MQARAYLVELVSGERRDAGALGWEGIGIAVVVRNFVGRHDQCGDMIGRRRDLRASSKDGIGWYVQGNDDVI